MPTSSLAKIRLIYRPAFKEPNLGPGIWIGGVAKGGDGIIILSGGMIKHIPPHSPLFRVLEQISIYESSEAIASVQVRDAVRRETLSAIASLVENQMQTLQTFRQPAPSPQNEGHEEEPKTFSD